MEEPQQPVTIDESDKENLDAHIANLESQLEMARMKKHLVEKREKPLVSGTGSIITPKMIFEDVDDLFSSVQRDSIFGCVSDATQHDTAELLT